MTPFVCLADSLRGLRSNRRWLCSLLLMLSALMVTRIFSLDATTAQKLQDAKQQGLPVKAEASGNLNVQDNVSIEAVLLPARVCQEVFGKEISRNYAAVEVTVSNRNHDAAMIVHSIFIDYSDWALSGITNSDGNSHANVLQPWQTGAAKSQISSVEYRVARGQLLDRQPWTARNIFIRSLVAAGSIATAYTFVTTDMDIVRGAAAFAGTGVPAAQTFWPDGTIGQMNRISDVGFQVNKVIPKDSSDIVVAFFPIDRFLTPGLKNLFLKSPALFFAPGAMAIDPEARKALEPIAKQLVGNTDAKAELEKLPKDYLAGKTDTPLVQFLNRLSLNNVRVVVGGILTVDVNTVPATISSVTMDGGNDSADFANAGDHLGVMQGSYLSGATPVVTAADGTQMTVTAVPQESTPSQLRFKLTLPDGFKAQSLTFKAVKKDKDNKDIESMAFPVAIGPAAK